jgi:hypothetical protein
LVSPGRCPPAPNPSSLEVLPINEEPLELQFLKPQINNFPGAKTVEVLRFLLLFATRRERLHILDGGAEVDIVVQTLSESGLR